MITLEVQTSDGGWLVLTDSWYPGWQATLDGNPVPILRANAAFRAIAISAGPHSVSYAYRPLSFQAGAGLSGASLLVLVVLFLASQSRRRPS